MEDIIFVGVDIPKAVEKVLGSVDVCEGMTSSEKSAYDLGVKNALSALKGLLYVEYDNEVCVHIPGVADYGEEFDYDELKKLILE